MSKRVKKPHIPKIDLIDPKNEHGYTDEELKELMTEDEYIKFCSWISGQTVGVDRDGQALFYPWDVKRFIRLVRFGVPTYFD